MAEDKNTGSEIEFNSMVAILKRLDVITYEINDARERKDIYVMVDKLVAYYKEISPDLTPDETKIWKEINVLKRFTTPLVEEKTSWILNKADGIDIRLRGLAKKHGYLTKNIKNLRKSIIAE